MTRMQMLRYETHTRSNDAARFHGEEILNAGQLPVVLLLSDLSGTAADAWKFRDKY